MRLKHITLVNWGNLPSRTYPIKNVTAITGDTGAGKTSMLDAMIALMSGGISRIGRLNTASEDGEQKRTRGKEYREIPEYILGAHKKLFARNSAHGYIAMSFVPDEDEEGAPISAVLGVTAELEESGDGPNRVRKAVVRGNSCLALVIGETLSVDDFQTIEGSRRTVLRVEACIDALRSKYGILKGARRTGTLGFSGEPYKFLQNLYGRLRGREEVSREEAERCALVFCRFVPQESVDDINEFVRKFIMPDPRGSDDFISMREFLRTNRDLARRAEELRAQKTYLEQAVSACGQHATHYIFGRALACEALRTQHREVENGIQTLALKIQELGRQIDADTQAQAATDQRVTDERERLATMDLKLRRFDVHAEYEQLQSAVSANRLALQELRKKAGDAYMRLQSVAPHLPVMEAARAQKEWAEISGMVDQAMKQSGASPRTSAQPLKFIRSMEEEPARPTWERIKNLCAMAEAPLLGLRDRLCGADRPLVAAIAAAGQDLKTQFKKTQEQLAKDRAELGKLIHSNRVEPPPWAQATLQYIQEHYSDANPVFLCDLINGVREKSWQAAIEGYIGNDRFNIVVDAKYEARVDRLLERFRGRSAAMIQGQLALEALAQRRAKGRRLEQDSMVREIVSDNEVALAYLEVSYGNVIKVPDNGDLSKVPRGIKRTGRGAGSLKTYDVLDRAQYLYFGREAVEARKRALEEGIEHLSARETALIAGQASLDALKRGEAALFELGDESLGRFSEDAMRRLDAIESASKSLAVLEKGEYAEVRTQCDTLRTTVDALDQLSKSYTSSIAKNQIFREEAEDSLKASTANLAALKIEIAGAVGALAGLYLKAPWVNSADVERSLEAVRSGAKIEAEIRGARNSMGGAHTRFIRAALEYNRALGVQEPLKLENMENVGADTDDAFKVMVKHYVEAKRILDKVAMDQLSSVSAKLAQQSVKIRETFATYFCDRLLEDIDEGARQLAQLNSDLAEHQFQDERYRFQGLPTSDDYAKRLSFFRFVREKNDEDRRSVGQQAGFDLMDDEMLSAEHVAIRNEILGFFASDDPRAIETLERIADYRNYYMYEMYKGIEVNGEVREIAMSKHGKDSGGEKENALLIARAATITSAFELKDKGPSLRFVAIDEMMKKTGEGRIRESVAYLSQTMKLQVLFVMPTRAIGPFKDIADVEYNIARTYTTRPEGELQDRVIVSEYVYDRTALSAMKAERLAVIEARAIQRFEREEAKIP
jgi:hypothetical protein